MALMDFIKKQFIDIIQWTEDGDFDATTFRWKHLVLAGVELVLEPMALINDSRGVPESSLK